MSDSERENGSTPPLAGVRAPWDRGERPGTLQSLKEFPQTISYMFKFGSYWAPETVDAWKYREQLRQLDWLALRALKSQGAMTAEELTDWLNRERRLRTNPEKTGIEFVSLQTIRDWIACASRRDLVAPSAGWVSTNGEHWGLSEHGRAATRSPLGAIFARLPLSPLLSLAAGGGIVAGLGWLQQHQTVMTFLIVLAVVVIYLGGLWLLANFNEKRDGPGLAVVWIETPRIAGKDVPEFAPSEPAG